MADIEIKARAFWTDSEGDSIAVGFAATEDPEDGYVLFEGKKGAAKKAVYVEVSDDIFGADDAIETVAYTDAGFTLTLTAKAAPKFGMVREVVVAIDPADADGMAALAVLKTLVA